MKHFKSSDLKFPNVSGRSCMRFHEDIRFKFSHRPERRCELKFLFILILLEEHGNWIKNFSRIQKLYSKWRFLNPKFAQNFPHQNMIRIVRWKIFKIFKSCRPFLPSLFHIFLLWFQLRLMRLKINLKYLSKSMINHEIRLAKEWEWKWYSEESDRF